MKTYTYDSNNSGGDWWLTEEDWVALEKAGWEVAWRLHEAGHLGYCDGDKDHWYRKPYAAAEPCDGECPGHRVLESHDDWKRNGAVTFLGAPATGAQGEFGSVEAAIASFEGATGQSYHDPGCDCCGPPHYIGER